MNADFRVKGASPTNHSWYQSSRVIALSCGITISAVHHLVLSQSTRVTDGRTDRRTYRQNYDSQDRPRICSRGKNNIRFNQRSWIATSWLSMISVISRLVKAKAGNAIEPRPRPMVTKTKATAARNKHRMKAKPVHSQNFTPVETMKHAQYIKQRFFRPRNLRQM